MNESLDKSGTGSPLFGPNSAQILSKFDKMADSKGAVYEFDDFRLVVGERLLLRSDKPIAMPSKAFDLLVALVENNGHLVEKEILYNRVWADAIVEDANLTVQISALRKALGNGYIKTVIGHGYRFSADVLHKDANQIVFESETETFSRITIEKEESIDVAAFDAEGRIVGESGQTADQARLAESGRFRRLPYFALALGVTILVAVFALSGYWVLIRARPFSNAAVTTVASDRQLRIRRLTSKGTGNQAVLSPDGKFFAYSVSEKENSGQSLWLGQTNGNSDLQLIPQTKGYCSPRAFSADGNWLYYAVSEPRDFDNATLYKIQVLGGVPQKVVQSVTIYTFVSPNEKQIAFVRGNRENKTSALVVANLDGTDPREIVVRPLAEAFSSATLAWSSDSERIAFAARGGTGKGLDVFSTNLGTGEVKQVTTLDWPQISKLAWINDGSGLVAVARDQNIYDSNQIWKIDYESGRAQKIVNDLLHYGACLSLSADSTALIALQAILESNIWIASTEDVARARQITFGSSGQEGWFGMDWTADGRIVYAARVDRSLTLWTIDAEGKNAKQVTSVGFLDTLPSATADGKYFVFQSNRSGESEIWRVQPDGTDLRQLTFDGGNSAPHTTPDSRTVVYSHGFEGVDYAWRVSIDGGKAERITNAQCESVRVSPDGKFLACGARSDGKAHLTISSIESGEPVRWFDVPPTYNFTGSIRWSRDGNFINYRDWGDGIWSQAMSGGVPTRLKGLPSEKLYSFQWSPDGKQFAFTRGRSLRDFVLISDFK